MKPVVTVHCPCGRIHTVFSTKCEHLGPREFYATLGLVDQYVRCMECGEVLSDRRKGDRRSGVGRRTRQPPRYHSRDRRGNRSRRWSSQNERRKS